MASGILNRRGRDRVILARRLIRTPSDIDTPLGFAVSMLFGAAFWLVAFAIWYAVVHS
jgi:hypothetical protein